MLLPARVVMQLRHFGAHVHFPGRISELVNHGTLFLRVNTIDCADKSTGSSTYNYTGSTQENPAEFSGHRQAGAQRKWRYALSSTYV